MVRLAPVSLLLFLSSVEAFLPPLAPPTPLSSSSNPSTSTNVQPPFSRTMAPLYAFSFLTKPKPSEAVSSARIGEIKAEILKLCRNKDNGLKVTAEEQEKIFKLAAELAKYNKVKSIARSSKVDGLWSLVYTSTKGSSSGKLGPFVGEVLQDIDTASGEYINYVRLGGGLVEGSLTATWDVKGENLWNVIFQTITFKLLGLPLVNKKPLPGQVGQWRLTYLDEDLRVLYAAGMTNQGKPAKVENIYILQRK